MSAPPPERGARALWSRAERVIVGLLGLAALLAGSVQVLGRYLAPAHAISWAEEVIVYLLVWAVMIVASELARSDGHVRPDVVLRLLSPAGQRWLEIANSLVAVVFCAGLVYYGWQIVATAWLLDERSSTDLQFPMWLYYLALPVGGGLMALRYLARLGRYLFAFDARRMTIGRSDVTRTE
ncbi:TRAP transporter small permease [Acidibrevibacterium fodinaquatile]|uniref:TRAP transporter small permease n=1 Tax=Acidibrevibacterium fodinaquatile TaxID=1969806 RepID=UPI000E0D3E3B|nr:TRAP transporter small permease [Acidibrevibacterium fodinaquatile]